MPITDLLIDGLRLMALGMGIVFGFLVLLVFVLRFMSWMIGVLGDPTQVMDYQHQSIPQIQPQNTEQNLIAVISAAVMRYRTAHTAR